MISLEEYHSRVALWVSLEAQLVLSAQLAGQNLRGDSVRMLGSIVCISQVQ